MQMVGCTFFSGVNFQYLNVDITVGLSNYPFRVFYADWEEFSHLLVYICLNDGISDRMAVVSLVYINSGGFFVILLNIGLKAPSQLKWIKVQERRIILDFIFSSIRNLTELLVWSDKVEVGTAKVVMSVS